MRFFAIGAVAWLLSCPAWAQAGDVNVDHCMQLYQDMQLYKAGKGDQAAETLNGTKLGLQQCVLAGIMPKELVQSFIGG